MAEEEGEMSFSLTLLVSVPLNAGKEQSSDGEKNFHLCANERSRVQLGGLQWAAGGLLLSESLCQGKMPTGAPWEWGSAAVAGGKWKVSAALKAAEDTPRLCHGAQLGSEGEGADVHRITAWQGAEGTSGHHPVQPLPAKAASPRAGCSLCEAFSMLLAHGG